MQIKLSDLCNITMGQSPKSIYYNKSKIGTPFMQGCTTFGRIYPRIDTWTTTYNKSADSNDILFTVRAPVGDINIALTKIAIGRGLAALKPTSVSTKYLYYLLLSNRDLFTNNSSGTVYDSINKSALENITLNIHSKNQQLLIVDIIGSLDDKIESNNKIIEKIDKLGLSKYKKIKNDFIDFNDFANFEKGKEASSQNYMSEKNNENINFIRVKDLNSLTDTYISKTLDIPVAKPNDVLISFDGAIGRINYGLVGAYSSGIYKVIPKFTNDYGILYWSLKDNTNQQIMLEHTNGTTILHGSKSIKYLKIKKHLQDDIDCFNKFFDYSLNIKLENKKLCELKKLYLKKFFG